MNKQQDEAKKITCKLKKILNDPNCHLMICSHRENNYYFYSLYKLNKYEIKEYLLNLKPNDYVKKTMNKNLKYPIDWLYIYSPTIKLINSNFKESYEKMYIKLSLLEKDKVVITVSFHRAMYELKK